MHQTGPLQAKGSGTGGSCKPQPGLYLVATPIGNLRDITLRALDTLAGVDVIACEDTRVSAKLLRAYGLEVPLLPYHDHNADAMRPRLLERLREGEAVALVSDAGTPLISDPGFKLVRACAAEGIPVTALPGASAVLTALQLSAQPSDRFLFAGFLPPRTAARRTALAALAALRASLIFFESGPRLAGMLADLAGELGPRPAAVARELTKLFEEVRRAPLPDLAAHYAAAGPPKGEIVVVVGPPDPDAAAGDSDEALDAMLAAALTRLSVRDAVAEVCRHSSRPRREVYSRALALSQEGAGADDNAENEDDSGDSATPEETP